MKAGKVLLRQEVFSSDAWKLIEWLEDTEITQYLNEKQNVGNSIRQVISRVNLPILTHLFNQDGSFFILTTPEDEPIGFLRLIPKGNNTEMVIVIGDKKRWGMGLGSSAIFQGLKHAFFQWRSDKVVAKIKFKNERSVRVFKKVGFKKEKELLKEAQYAISIDEFLKSAA
ncbi:GNAT family N-acetyltransferase [Clostridium swellfunianum]|uniref:GNAT family N-acetyltransferase n=1 Tax=Clostridium swellfunianum TaxID=1367462 RepID=UPI00202E4297|nr:GNAT family protein [Clostridium swellfunianum]MCM0650722.1 GNAT family N-acetyltransferase [Clostridium swellfunianum]